MISHLFVYLLNIFITLAGDPTAIENAGISFVTKLIEPIIAPSPIVTPGKIDTNSPIQTLLPILTSLEIQIAFSVAIIFSIV